MVGAGKINISSWGLATPQRWDEYVVSLYKILQCTILYGVLRENGGSEGG